MQQGLIRWTLLILCVLAQGCVPRTWSPPTKAPAGIPASQHSTQALPALSQADVLTLLKSDQYTTLDQHFSALQQQYVDGAIADSTLRDSFRVFYPTDRTLAARYDAWVARFPKSYVAHLARAIYYKKIGQQSRGDKYIRDTTDAQLAGMTEAFGKALQDLHACADLDPKPTLAYGHALDISSYSGGEDERELQDLAAQVDPENIIVRLKYMTALKPRWGGSYEQMEAFLEESRRGNLSLSKLHLLEAVIVEDRASVDYERQRWATAAKEYLHAIELGADDLDCLGCAAYAQIKAEDWPQAVKLYTRLLEKNPNDADALSFRGWAYDRMDNPHAVEDFTAAANLGDAFSQNRLGEFSFYGIPDVVPKNRESAIKWFRMSADQGYPDGVKNLQMALAQLQPGISPLPSSRP
jgi:tetratricopeptide (TPR) repeat protein